MSDLSIPIILGTSRANNESQKVAFYLHQKLSSLDGVRSEILDIGDADFPMLVDRVSEGNPISSTLTDWTEKIKLSDGIVIVSPEYKSGYPGSLKNFLDYLPPGIFRYKPVGISTVSSGIYAGTSCLSQLRQVVIGMAGLVIPDRFQVGNIQDAFNDKNELLSEKTQRVSEKFVSELIKYSTVLQSL